MTIREISISPAGLGTVKFGRDRGVKYPNTFSIPDDNEVKNLLSLAKTLGINLLDTAPAYGNSEARLGQLLAHRDEWVICTKVGETFENGYSHFDFSSQAIYDSIHRSLKRLRSDYIDIVLIHSDGKDLERLNNGEMILALQKLQKEGKIRAIGLSGKTAVGGVAALKEYDLDIAMITHNPVYQQEQEVIEVARQFGKGIFIKKAFASGHLRKLGDDPVQKTMDFIFQQNKQANLAVILGTINSQHLKQNVEAIYQALNSQ